MNEINQTVEITSVQNPQVKQWAQLLERKGRDKQHKFIIEGIHLVEEAIASGQLPETILYCLEKSNEEAVRLVRRAAAAGIHCVHVTAQVLSKCTDTETPQPVAAIMPKLSAAPEQLIGSSSARELVIVIDGIQDPGNLGTIIRSADAAGATGVLLGKGTVDLYNPKTVRATMGSLFHLPIAQGDLTEWLPRASGAGIHVVAAGLKDAVSCYDYDFRESVWIMIGNEGSGVSQQALALCERQITIPMQGNSESLNAAMAATILLFEVMRQRLIITVPE